MSLIYAILGTIIQVIAKAFFINRSEEKATDTIIKGKTDVIEQIGEAKKARERLVADLAYSKRVRSQFTRKDDE